MGAEQAPTKLLIGIILVSQEIPSGFMRSYRRCHRLRAVITNNIPELVDYLNKHRISKRIFFIHTLVVKNKSVIDLVGKDF